MKPVYSSFLLLGLFILSATTFSQTASTKGPKTYFDIMVNIVSTNLHYGDKNSQLDDYRKSNNGLQAGVSFQAGVTRYFSLVSELYYIRKGGSLKVNNALTTEASRLRIHAIELPVLARLHLGNFYINAGPSVSYNLSGSWKIKDQSTKLSFDNSINGFKRIEPGAQVGGGWEFPFKQKRIALDVRYSHGLTNLSHSEEMYNRAIMVSVHFSKAWKRNPLSKI